jgi:lysozyme
MPYFQGAQIASMFGINEHTFQMLEAGLPEMQKFLAMREKMFRAAGINPDAMTARGHEFMTHLRTMGAALENLADIVAYRLMPWGEKLIDWISNVVMWFTRADKATDGWSSKLLGLAGILGGGAALKGGLGLLGKIFGGGAKSVGKGGAAAAEGAAAAGGAEAAAGGALAAGGEAAGGGLLAGVALPAIIIAAVGAALVWMMTHKEQVRAAVSEAFDWTKKTAEAVKTDVGAGFHAMGDAATKAGGWMKALAMQPGFLGDLGRLTGKFEGFRDKVYRDVAGNLTFGFGHKVKPGENMQGADPMKLFSKDLSGSLGDVLSLVRVKLGQNQIKALTDLEFNIGKDAFAKSTLLRRVNAGDMAGAADQFQYWNKITKDGHKIFNQQLADRRQAEANLFRAPDAKTLNLKTDIHIDGGGGSRETARETASEQKRVYGDIVRNFAGAHQ